MVLPTRAAVLAFVAVALAAVALVTTRPADPQQATPVAVEPSPTASATPSPTATTPAAKPKPKPTVARADVVVEVYNNSGISGLAGSTSDRAASSGWNVVGSDNWYGTIPATTVYFPPRLEAAAKLLAKDLGIQRMRPAVAPMRLDRLTVILTADYS
ncbi:hypothetical protein GCM10027425_15850 [Alteromonas gracilis]